MVTIYAHRNGETDNVPNVDPAWLDPASGVTVWVDVAAPSSDEARILTDVFHFHPLSVEDALASIHSPKIEPYPGYLYLILHGIDFDHAEREFATHDVDFFLGRNYLVTVHDGRSRSIAKLRMICDQHEHVLAEGPAAVMHRIIDSMVENYRPEVDVTGRRDRQARRSGDPGRAVGSHEPHSCNQARSRIAAARCHPATRCGWPVGAPGVSTDQRRGYVPLSRCVRPVRAVVRRGDHVPGPDQRHPGRAPVVSIESPERRHESVDGDLDHLSAVDRADRHVGHERAIADASRRGDGPVLVGRGDDGW